jgi:hypothetical protein
MKASRIQSIILHFAATMLLSCGFVKTADKIDLGHSDAVMVKAQHLAPHFIGTLPCGSTKDN